ncbi:MAG: urea transporter [Gammaproteobacteria bacterium]|jgi:urea transporter
MDAALTTDRNPIRAWLTPVFDICRCYAAVLFCDSPAVGAMVLGVTLSIPNIGIAGLLAALTAYLFARRFGFTKQHNDIQHQEPYVYNSLLVGLALGSLYQINVQLIPLIALGTVFTVLTTQFLAHVLWRIGRLPVLSLPFVLVTWILWLAAKSMMGLEPFVAVWPDDLLAIPWLSGLFKALGLFFFIPHPLAGLFLFLGIAWTSRYLAILAVTGYVTGYLTMQFIVGYPQSAPFIGFNFMLVAMAIGGIFTVPGREGFLVATFGAALCAVLAVAIGKITLSYGLPVLTMPFVVTTLIILAGMSRRHIQGAPYLLLENPALPETSYERLRLASVRTGEIGSIPLLAPFLGQWQVYQGFNGPHTHQPPWQHALDFFIMEGQCSFRSDGRKLEDYHCFGATVVAPAQGQVVACRGDLPDNPPGEVDTVRNWGNYIQIRIAGGQIVVLAHLRQHSLLIKEGEWVTAGQCLANCGNSGRSPQPHLHLHIQNELFLGSPTVPFHLCSVITRTLAQEPQTFQLTARPAESVTVAPALRDDKLATPLHLPVGRCLYFRFRATDDDDWSQRTLKVELTLLGQFRLVSDSGASVAFEETQGLLAFYDRQGGNDILLDMWLLGMGLTPLSNNAVQWQDKPPARFLPLRRWQWMLMKMRPLEAALNSRYQRHWYSQNGIWQQHGRHELKLFPGLSVHVTTLATLSPQTGCTALSIQAAGQHWEAELHATGLIADNGVPAWVDVQKSDLAPDIQSANI